MRFVIVTGMSGAGKSTALKMLEDAEYFCVDNLPIPLVEKFAQLTADGTSGEIQKVAVGIDIRSGQALPDLQNVLEWMSINGICYEILFLDASDDVYRDFILNYKARLRKAFCKMCLTILESLYCAKNIQPAIVVWRLDVFYNL